MTLRIRKEVRTTMSFGVYEALWIIEKRVRLFPRARWEPLSHYANKICFRRRMDAVRYIDLYNSLKRR